MFIGIVLSFIKFGFQMSKNPHDILKVCLETTLCVLPYFIKFYTFVFDKIYVGGHKLVYKHINIGKVCENDPKAHPRVIEEGPFIWDKDV